jgi:hypothetical protein
MPVFSWQHLEIKKGKIHTYEDFSSTVNISGIFSAGSRMYSVTRPGWDTSLSAIFSSYFFIHAKNRLRPESWPDLNFLNQFSCNTGFVLHLGKNKMSGKSICLE